MKLGACNGYAMITVAGDERRRVVMAVDADQHNLWLSKGGRQIKLIAKCQASVRIRGEPERTNETEPWSRFAVRDEVVTQLSAVAKLHRVQRRVVPNVLRKRKAHPPGESAAPVRAKGP